MVEKLRENYITANTGIKDITLPNLHNDVSNKKTYIQKNACNNKENLKTIG
jgi:hypothetical protein